MQPHRSVILNENWGLNCKKKGGCARQRHENPFPATFYNPQKNPLRNSEGVFDLVPREGLEPPRLAAIGPKPIVSTNSTTEAKKSEFSI